MDQGVRERAEARLRALFQDDIAAGVALLLKLNELGAHTVQAVYEFLEMASDEQWQEGIRLAKKTAECRCPNCNIHPEPPIMGKHVGMG